MSSTNEPEKKEPQTPRPESATSECQAAAEESLVTEVDVLHAFVEEYKTRDDQNSCLQRRNFWLGVTTAILLFAYTTITALQWNAIIESNRINREALTSVQRAYVSFQGLSTRVTLLNPVTGKNGAIQFVVTWRNDGTTAAQASGWVHEEQRPDALPRNFTFTNPLNPDDRRTFVIGPKGTTDSGIMLVPESFLDKVQQGSMHLYFWGAITYRDIFKDTPMHLTEFCVEVMNIIPLVNESTGSWVSEVASCPQHNCYDQTCPDYQERIDEAVSEFFQLKENPQ